MLILFFCITLLRSYTNNKHVIFIYELTGMASNNSLLTFCVSVAFLSLMGIPPFIGFITKFFILTNLSYYPIIFFFLMFFSVISSYYYLRFIKILLFDKINTRLFVTTLSWQIQLFVVILTSFLLLSLFKSS